MMAVSSGHIWDLERCELCGDKDWMADKFCAKNPEVETQRAEWLLQQKSKNTDTETDNAKQSRP